MFENKKTLICRCAERGLVDIADLSLEGAVITDDLCAAANHQDALFKTKFETIHACHPRAVKALFEMAGRPLPDSVTLHNHRHEAPVVTADPSMVSDPAWFPLIDQNRCTHCGQCQEFCLFEVFKKSKKGAITVNQPLNCKNNCPACARICPESAIIFAKCNEVPINGAEVTDEAQRAANVKVNMDEILGSDPYKALNARKEKRQSLLNQKKIEQALSERRRCSKESH